MVVNLGIKAGMAAPVLTATELRQERHKPPRNSGVMHLLENPRPFPDLVLHVLPKRKSSNHPRVIVVKSKHVTERDRGSRTAGQKCSRLQREIESLILASNSRVRCPIYPWLDED